MKPIILFVSSNDGSDMRINKEVETLSRTSRIIFLGVGPEDNCYVKKSCSMTVLINGRRNTMMTQIRLVYAFAGIIFKNKIASIHIINEQLLIFFYPFLFGKHVVLDLFDSIFLRWNKPGNRWIMLKKIVYLPVNKILVTDTNRLNLMPDFIRKKCLVLPNYPHSYKFEIKQKSIDKLTILYNGWMGLHRGTEVVEGLLKTRLPLRVIMAGWFSDDYTRGLPGKYSESIEFLGVLPQEEASRIAAKEADYILCVYEPINENTINASPNKIYDAIQTDTPVIINQEVKVSGFVNEYALGIVIPTYYVADFHQLYFQLAARKNSFGFSTELKKKYSWENVEDVLLEAHSCR